MEQQHRDCAAALHAAKACKEDDTECLKKHGVHVDAAAAGCAAPVQCVRAGYSDVRFACIAGSSEPQVVHGQFLHGVTATRKSL